MFYDRPQLPAINYGHPACKNLQFLWAATPGLSAYDLVKRAFGTVTGSPALAYDAIVGPTIKFRSLTNDVYTFTGRNTICQPGTFGVIGVLNGTGGGSRTYFQNSSAATGFLIDNQSSGSFQLVARNIAVWLPAIAISTATPYLMVMSASKDGDCMGMLVNLKTRLITTARAGIFNNTAAAGNGTFLLGNADPAANSADADLAGVLFSNVYLSFGELQQWGRDPWGPWRGSIIDPAMLNFVLPASAGVPQSFVSMM
jgi:hypothetical protein